MSDRVSLVKDSLIKICLFVSLAFMSTNSHAEIIEIDKATDILPYTYDFTENDLITIDVKNVIFEPEDVIMHPSYKKELQEYFDQIEEEFGHEKSELFQSVIVGSYVPVLIDPEMPSVIKDIQKRDIKIIALTSGRIGSSGSIKSREELRFNRIKSFGIDFSKSFLCFNEVNFKNFTFQNGILFANRVPKGEVISELFRYSNFKPKRLMHIDNSLSKLNNMKEFCAKNKIDFLGIYFSKSYKNTNELNKKLTDYKFNILKEKHLWISNESAETLLK